MHRSECLTIIQLEWASRKLFTGINVSCPSKECFSGLIINNGWQCLKILEFLQYINVLL